MNYVSKDAVWSSEWLFAIPNHKSFLCYAAYTVFMTKPNLT